MDKIDFFKLHKADYIAPKKPQTCHVANAHYLAINGIGGPGEDNFNDASVLFLLKVLLVFNKLIQELVIS